MTKEQPFSGVSGIRSGRVEVGGLSLHYLETGQGTSGAAAPWMADQCGALEACSAKDRPLSPSHRP